MYIILVTLSLYIDSNSCDAHRVRWVIFHAPPPRPRGPRRMGRWICEHVPRQLELVAINKFWQIYGQYMYVTHAHTHTHFIDLYIYLYLYVYIYIHMYTLFVYLYIYILLLLLLLLGIKTLLSLDMRTCEVAHKLCSYLLQSPVLWHLMPADFE